MKETGKVALEMALELCYGKMGPNMKDIGGMGEPKVTESRLIRMGIYMRETGKEERHKAKEFC